MRVAAALFMPQGLPPEAPVPGLRMIDLEIDSLDTIELLMRPEEEFGVEVSDRDRETLPTLGHVIPYFEGR